MTELLCIPTEKVNEMWPHVVGMIQKAVDKCGDWTVESIKEALDQDRMLLWLTWDGARVRAVATTGLEIVPRGKVCKAIACAGDDPSWSERLAPIEQYARDQGCVAMRVQGRPGWSRVLRDYEIEWVALEKRLD